MASHTFYQKLLIVLHSYICHICDILQLWTEMANIARQLKYFQSKRSPRARSALCSIQIYLSYGRCTRQVSRPTLINRPRPRPGTHFGKRSTAEFDDAKIAHLEVDDTDIGDLEVDDAKIGDLEGEYLFNPTRETALSLLEARPWKGKSLVSLAIPFCSHVTSCLTVWPVSQALNLTFKLR